MVKWTVRALVVAMFVCLAAPLLAGDDNSDAELGLVAINVADLERSETYYAEVLGFTRAWQYPPDSDDPIEIGLVAPGGGAGLALAHLNDDPLPEGKGRYGRIIVNTANAKALAKRAEAAGSTCVTSRFPATIRLRSSSSATRTATRSSCTRRRRSSQEAEQFSGSGNAGIFAPHWFEALHSVPNTGVEGRRGLR